MRFVTTAARSILDTLTADLELHGHRTIRKTPAFLAIHIKRFDVALFSVAHFIDADGDRKGTPHVIFWRDGDGDYCPLSLHDRFGYLEGASITREAEGEVRARVRDIEVQAAICRYCDTWTANMKTQQRL